MKVSSSSIKAPPRIPYRRPRFKGNREASEDYFDPTPLYERARHRYWRHMTKGHLREAVGHLGHALTFSRSGVWALLNHRMW